MNDAGRIGFVLKGDFVLSQPYEFLDVVKDHNATYVAKENTINEPTSNTQKWQCIMDADVEGLVHVCTVNPSGTQFSSNWLMEDGAVITPEPEDLYRVVFGGKERLFFWNSVDNSYEMISGGGHTIISSSMLPMGGSIAPMAGRDNLQFGSEYDPIFTEDDPTNNKTIVHGQLFICDSESDWNTLSDEAFKAKYGADREQVGVYWYLPWANSIAYQTDLTPVGTVLSLAVDTTRLPADLIEFPNKDYVICRGATVKITDYPALYQYFADKYGDGNYFGTAQTAEDDFVLPYWSADFPTNGVLVIKARVTSDVITFAEVDKTGISSRTDEVPSCARVAGIEENINNVIKFIDVTKNNVTFTNQYIDIGSWRPSTPEGYSLMAVNSYSASYSSSISKYPEVQGNGQYVFGEQGKTYSSITLRYIYYKTS